MFLQPRTNTSSSESEASFIIRLAVTLSKCVLVSFGIGHHSRPVMSSHLVRKNPFEPARILISSLCLESSFNESRFLLGVLFQGKALMMLPFLEFFFFVLLQISTFCFYLFFVCQTTFDINFVLLVSCTLLIFSIQYFVF